MVPYENRALLFFARQFDPQTFYFVFQLNLSAKCYARSLQIEDLPGGWHDLGMAYYLLAESSRIHDGKLTYSQLI